MRTKRDRLMRAACLAAALALPAAPAPAAPFRHAAALAQALGEPMAVPDADRQAIRQVIESQLQAFLRDDGSAAFAFATPAIQAMFQTPDNFMAMVRAGYQPVYRPQAVSFKDIVEFNGGPAQRVVVVGPDGVPVMAVYPMRRMEDGSWRIDGCYLLHFRRDDA
jgi:hypothetical protein